MQVNGLPRELSAPTVHAALHAVGVDASARYIAVAVNDAVVRRAEWSARTLRPDDTVEVITAVAGG